MKSGDMFKKVFGPTGIAGNYDHPNSPSPLTSLEGYNRFIITMGTFFDICMADMKVARKKNRIPNKKKCVAWYPLRRYK